MVVPVPAGCGVLTGPFAPVVMPHSVEVAANVAARLLKPEPPADDLVLRSPRADGDDAAAAGLSADSTAEGVANFNAGQRAAFTVLEPIFTASVRHVIASSDRGTAPAYDIHYLEGGPGSSKTFVLTTLIAFVKAPGCKVITCAPLASAANLFDGVTMHSSACRSIKVDPPIVLNATKLAAARLHLETDTSCAYIMDEVLAVSHVILVALDCCMRQLICCDRPCRCSWLGISTSSHPWQCRIFLNKASVWRWTLTPSTAAARLCCVTGVQRPSALLLPVLQLADGRLCLLCPASYSRGGN